MPWKLDNRSYALPEEDDAEHVCVKLSIPSDEVTISNFVGALNTLALWSNYRRDEDKRGTLIANVWKSIVQSIEFIDCTDCAPGCDEYQPSEDIITWSPQNPYTEPDYVPPHYAFPPWVVLGTSVPFSGLQAGDVITSLLRAPIDTVLAGGFPRFRIAVNGPGTVELSLLRFPTASLALISVDDNPLSLKWTDLNVSLSAALGTPIPVEIVNVEVTGEGDHHIDVTIVPTVGATPPYVNFGGGIRQVALCGFGNKPKPKPKSRLIVIEQESYVSICQQLRFKDGKLQGLCGVDCDTNEAVWEDICGQDDTDSGDNQPGPTPRPDPGKEKCFTVTLKGNAQWQVPFSVRDGDTVTITNAKGGWYDGNVAPWHCPDGSEFILGVCAGSPGYDGGDPAPSEYHMRVVYSVGDTWYDGYNTTQILPDGTGNQTLTLQANDGTLTDNQGSITLKICVKNGSTAPTAGWCKTFDFTLNDGGFMALTDGIDPVGVYSPGVGWIDTGDPLAVGMQIFCPVAPPDTVFTQMVMKMDSVTSDDPDPRAFAENSTGTVDLGGGIVDDVQIYDVTFTSPYTGSKILCIYNPGSGSPTTHAIVAITLHGTGPNPFGSDNC